jgi:hypothetical protein
MLRDRALKVFCAGIYPIADALWHPDPAEAYGDYMMLSLYVTLGVFLLIAARHLPRTEALSPSPLGRDFAHALVMGTMGFQFANQRVIPSTSPRREQFHSK